MNPSSLIKKSGRKVIVALAGFVLLYLTIKLFSFYSHDLDDDLEYQNLFINKYGVFALNSPKHLSFCGEAVPASDLNIRERLDKELLSNTYFQSNTMLLFKGAHQWFPLIEPILKKYNIPDDFKYLPLVESNLSNTVSPAGATGFWQLMKNTAAMYDLEVNDEVDERYNVVKSTVAACRYLQQSYQELHNWTLCVAAYNMGIEGIKNQIIKQKTNNFYDLFLNTETSRYVFRVLAIKEILENPRNYGYYFREKDLYPNVPTHSVKIDSTITDLVEFAQSHNINYKILKIYNPWLISSALNNIDHKTYYITIPDSGYHVFDTIPVEIGNSIIFNQGADSIKFDTSHAERADTSSKENR